MHIPMDGGDGGTHVRTGGGAERRSAAPTGVVVAVAGRGAWPAAAAVAAPAPRSPWQQAAPVAPAARRPALSVDVPPAPAAGAASAYAYPNAPAPAPQATFAYSNANAVAGGGPGRDPPGDVASMAEMDDLLLHLPMAPPAWSDVGALQV